MTDPRLAAGLVREGFRNDFKPSPGRSNELANLLEKLWVEIRTKGSVSKQAVDTYIATERRLKSNPHELLFLEHHRNPGRPKLTQHVEEALTVGYFIPAKGTYEGRHEQFRRYVMAHDRVGRTSLDYRYLLHRYLVREHAMVRFIERDGGGYYEMTSALWPGFLILEAIALFRGASESTSPFVVPSSKGLFLGTRTWSQPDAKMPTVQRGVLTREGWKDETHALYEGPWPEHVIHTYVSPNETSLAQDELAETALTLINRHQAALKAIHMMDVLKFPTPADAAIISAGMPHDFELVRSEFAALFSSALWREQVRMPRNMVATRANGQFSGRRAKASRNTELPLLK